MTEPLTPAGCDLQDFPFMPLDVARLRDSELTTSETPEACWAALLLWCTSWHQVPAGSLPNDEKWIADKAGYVARGKVDRSWKDVKAGAMRGWLLCSDGRYYHPVVCEKARDAWQAKLRQRWGTECARIKKHNDRHEGANVPKPTFDEWMAAGCPQGQPLFVPGDTSQKNGDVPGETASKGEREGQGQGDSSSAPTGADGAGAPSPVDKSTKTPEELAKAEVWKAAVLVLQAGGCAEETLCRTFMGQLVKDYTFPIVKEAVAKAVVNEPVSAREWLVATCKALKAQQAEPEADAKPQPVKGTQGSTVPGPAETRRMLEEQERQWQETQRIRRERKAAEEAARADGSSPSPEEQPA